jgi:IPT/TIG domain
MNEATQLAASAAVSPGWKWLAVLIGLAVLASLYLMAAVFSSWNPWKLVEGADGRASTSKFQWLLWIVVIIFAYTVLWVLRAKQGDYSAISQVPVNLLTVLGFSTGTAAAAKGITSGYVQTNRVAKPAVAKQGAPGGTSQGGLLQDDTGVPELAKIQMIGFTLIAAGIFLATLVHQIVSEPVITSLPNLDSSLLVLMGISQGGYLGKKLVTFGAPTLYPPIPPEAAAGTAITLPGVNLGNPPVGSSLPAAPGSQLMLNGVPISPSSWSDTSIVFNVPGTSPVGNVAWTPPKQTVQLAVTVGGQTSNSVAFTVTS